ncbi:MAG TPA: pyridoxal phosphate-dependent aminotransferase [Solirubrobacteraceae bacterium]|jgi:aspartate/methionine/tyrosine aminotransferase|nr:pyridoxal phosphate-dependent aminotransferase [Solirubrobacteraceae bacterium]
MRLNPHIEQAPGYPFLRLAEARAAAQARGVEVVDLSMGQPTDPAPPPVREALVEAAASLPLCDYPSAAGLPELRTAIAEWIGRRFGVELDADREVLPTLGAKEPIAALARLFAREGDTVAATSPSYPVPERSARATGLTLELQRLREDRGWLPDPEEISWRGVAIVWVVSPHNPTGATAPLELLDELAERCRHRGAILAVDETYSEFWFAGRPPASALQLSDRRGVVVFNSLSKRSGLAGLRSGFLAGDPEIVSRIRRHRSDIGTTPQSFVQRASIVAWNEESHVREARERYAHKRALLAAAAARAGLLDAGGPAGIFLWLAVPGGDDERAYEQLLARSLLVVPGSYLGIGGEGYLRVALTGSYERAERAAELLQEDAPALTDAA